MEPQTRRSVVRKLAVGATVGGLGGAGAEALRVVDEPGRYELTQDRKTASVVIRADEVTFDGRGTTLRGSGTGIHVLGDGVWIRNLDFDLTDDPWDDLVVVEGNRCFLENVNTVSDDDEPGSGRVVAGGLNEVVVRDCDLRFSLEPFSFVGTDDVYIENCRAGRGDGRLGTFENVVIAYVDNNDFSGTGDGLVFENCSDCYVDGNVLGGRTPAVLRSCANCRVSDNTAVDVERGLVLDGGENNEVLDNVVCPERGPPVVLQGGATDSVVRNNGCYGSGVLEIVADDAPEFEYRFVAGNVSPRSNVEDGDRVVVDDDTTTVLGRVGNVFGDDYEVEALQAFSASAGRDDFDVFVDGENRTEALTGSRREFVVRSTGTGERFEYEARVTGAVELAETSPDRTEPPDRVEVTENGTFLRGEVGDGFGDRYLVWGDVTGFEATTSRTNYEYGFE